MEEDNDKSCKSYLNNNIANTMEISIAEASSMFPGFRFSPTDEELICFYLKRKIDGFDNGVEVIPEVDICRYEPWDLPARSIIQSDSEWFFFSPRGRKYPNGSQSKRATDSGYWKATGKERNVKSGSVVIGTKRTLVFHTGRAPKGLRTEWIMHEYCMTGKSQDLMVICRLRRNTDFNLDDTSRKKSQLERIRDLGNHATASSGIEQNIPDCSSSYNSHSVEQIDSGVDSDEKLANGLCQDHHASSSHHKDYKNSEEDCFADIMQDEIIKLDDHSAYLNTEMSRMVLPEPESKKKSKQPISLLDGPSPDQPLQGTANRRLRLRRLRPNPFGTYKVIPITSSATRSNSKIRGFKLLTRLSIFASLVILVSIILLVQLTKEC
ncbi:OLC1v1004691C1 [Oldenlandia corymbosa var. corymbosa]|uniref:OLC1v1004691C1 n=1 Tax=Oldenlandia corymbosa var. corymbosa TaxID=529605 RepID=A0AAV1DE74_OLDCO|nr:OLC1v1004691C1 [Oldenlandia corymbosa var. corymbosa]